MTGTQSSQSSQIAQRAGDGASELPTFVPPADIVETSQAIVLLLEVPGADPDGISVTQEKRMLSVSARSIPFQPEGYTRLYAEYEDGNYERSFVLSEEVDRERIEAVVRDGVLRVTLPKTAPATAKKIQVKKE